MQETNDPIRERIVARFWSHVQKTDTCWIWTGAKAGHGYGTTNINRKMVYAHRLSWEFANGPIPPGMYVLHTCDNPPCCNPAHLFLGDHRTNMADMVRKRRNPTGADRPDAKLTKEQVIEIRNKYVPYRYTIYALAKEYGVTPACISLIVNLHTYKNIGVQNA